MENNNGADWLAVKAQASDKTFADIYSLGVDPSTTTLQSKDFYKKSDKIQQMFKTPEGKFDQKGFDAFYLDAEKSLNSFKQADFDLADVSTDLWEDTSSARYLKAPIRQNPVKVSLTSKDPFTNLKKAQGSFLGLTEINKWTDPTKTLSEVAQGQKVRDGITGKELGYTPEDTGLFNMFGFFNEPLVMAQYDADGVDDKGNKVKKGDMKYGKDGLPYFETLAGRAGSGKQYLSRWDTLTKEGSYANKFDFMDSDGFNKSLTGIVAKSAVQLAPFLIGGPVSAAMKAFYIAQGLMDGGAEIGKAIDGILNGPGAKKGGLYKFLNNLQGYNAQLKGGTSEYGREHFFGLETLSSLAIDSVYQLMGQRSIAQWPSQVKQYQIAKELNLATKGFLNAGDEATAGIFNAEAYIARYGQDWMTAAEAMSKNVKTLEKYQKYSGHISTAFMAATSAVGISQAADAAGLDERDKGFLYLGYAASLVPLFKSDIGNWVEKGLEVDHLAKGINKSIRDYSSKYLPNIMREAEQELGATTLKGRAISALAAGRNIGKHIRGLYSNVDTDGMLGKMGAEGLEEVTEQMLQNALQGVYNGLSAAGIRSTQEEAQFDLNAKDMAMDYLQNAVGGALGGAIFHKLDHVKTNIFQSNNMKEYVTEGHGAKVVERIKGMQEKGELGSTTLSTVPLTDEEGNVVPGMWKPVNDENPLSQNDLIADRMIKEIEVNEAQRKAFDIRNPDATAEGKSKFFQNLVDTKTDTDLRDRIHETASRIYEVAGEVQSIENLGQETDEGMMAKKKELKMLQKELEYLQSDESVDEYFRQGLFNIRTDINTAFGVKTRQSFTEDLIGKKRKYNLLNDSDKAIVDNAYEEYRLDGTESGLRGDLKAARLEYERFNTAMEGKGYNELEVFKQSLLDLGKYTKQMRVSYPDKEGATLDYPQLVQGYITQLQGVKYIPDYVFDEIKSQLNKYVNSGADVLLGALTTDLNKLKGVMNTGFSTIDTLQASPLFSEYLSKVMGESALKDFLSSVELDEVNKLGTNAGSQSLLKLLKTVGLSDNPDSKTLEYRDFLTKIEQMQQVDVKEIIKNIRADDSHEINQYLKKAGFLEFIDKAEGAFPYNEMINEIPAGNLVKNFAKYKLISDKSGVDVNPGNMIGYLERPGGANMILDLLVNGSFKSDDQVITTDILKQLPTEEFDAAVDLMKNFEAERIASPLRDIMKESFEFMENQMENLRLVGIENYVNSDEGFVGALDAHLRATKKLEAMVIATTQMNPLVNDFRKNHGSILPDTVKGIELFELSDQDAATLMDESRDLVQKLEFLKGVNDYNRNNILAKLLKEDGLILTSNVLTWKQISQIEEVAALLPSMSDIYGYDGAITDYAANPKFATEEAKFNALKSMAKFEHQIYTDFQKLSEADKLKVVNATFSAIDPTLEDFIIPIDGTKPLSAENQTLYLAKIFGTSSLQFAKDSSGDWSQEANEGRGGFDKIQNAFNTPFPIQENAIRLAYLLRNGDPSVNRWLFNAYTYADTPESETLNFDIAGSKSMSTANLVSIWGDPGTGKTSTVIAGIMNTMTPQIADTILLAPKKRQLASLLTSIDNAGLSDRVNKDHSLTVKDFLKSLNLKDKSGKVYNFDATDAIADRIKDPGTNDNATDKEDNDGWKALMKKEIGDVFKNLALYDSYSSTSATMKSEVTSMLANIRLLALDEFTHVNPVDLAIINELVNRYNETTTVQNDPNKKILFVTTGDINQMGYAIEGMSRTFLTYADMMASTPLTTSLRSAWDLVNNPQIDIKRRTSKVKNTEDLQSTDLLNSLKEPIRLTHVADPALGSIGIKVQNKSGATTIDQLKFITDNKDRFQGKDVVYVINDMARLSEVEALLSSAIGGDYRNFVDIYTPEDVQGGEYKYAIIDAAPKFGDTEYDVLRTFEFLNTMLSRATEATLFLNDGTVDKFVNLENDVKEKAVNQKKLTDDMRKEIKSNKQDLMKAILEDYVPEEAKKATTEPVTPGTGGKPSTEPDEPKADKITTVKASTLATIFGDKVFDPKTSKLKATPGLDATGETKQGQTKPTDVMAYTTFNTQADFDAIKKLMFAKNDEIPDDAATELVITSYKYYLLKRGMFDENNLTLNMNFVDYFDELDYVNPVYYVEATRRGEDGKSVGRNAKNDMSQSPDEIILSLKVKLPSLNGGDPLVLTLGMLNNIDSIKSKHLKEKSNPALSNKIVDLMNQISKYIIDDGAAPVLGQSASKIWRSFEFNQDQLDDISTLFTSRITYKSGNEVDFQDVVNSYPDFYITAPQVVVAKNLDNDIGARTANPYGSNPDYLDIWNKMKGKSIALITDVYALRGKTPQELLDIYFKQLDLFNNNDFLALSEEQKKFRIDENTKNGVVIKLDNVPNSTNTIPYLPGMVKITRLDNPKARFTTFREKFLYQLELGRKNKNLDIKESFKQFDMPVYVKDRLVKSLMVIHKFLQVKENQKWFEENVLVKHTNEVAERLERARQMIVEEYGGDYETASLIKPDTTSLRGVAMNNLTGVLPLTTSEFTAQLHQLLYNKENKLIRGFYPTEGTNSTKDSQLKTEFRDKDLDFNLSMDKVKDFSGSILSVNAFQLFLNTKNLNFTDLIDFSLEAFANMPLEGKQGKYSLKHVFADGEIESVVVAANAANTKADTDTNMLAEASQYGKGFTFNFESLQTSPYNIDFEGLFKHFEGKVEDNRAELEAEVNSKVAEIKKRFKLVQGTDFYKALNNSLASANTLEALADVEDNIKEVVVPKKPTKGNLSWNDIVAYRVDKDGVKEKIKLGEAVVNQASELGLIFEDQLDSLKVNLVSSTTTKAEFEITTPTSQIKVEFDLNADSTFTLLGVSTEEPVEGDEESKKKIDPMENIRKIEKAELERFDSFVKSTFGENLLGVDAIKDYTELYKQFFRYTVVTTNMAATGNDDLVGYDAEIAQFSPQLWQQQAQAFRAANATALKAARAQMEQMVKLTKLYKAC